MNRQAAQRPRGGVRYLPMNNPMQKSLAQVISRLTMALVAIALIYGGIKSLRASSRITAEFYQNHPMHDLTYAQRHDPSKPDTFLRNVGWALITTGVFLGFASLVPVSILQKAFQTFSEPPQLGDN